MTNTINANTNIPTESLTQSVDEPVQSEIQDLTEHDDDICIPNSVSGQHFHLDSGFVHG